MAIFSKKIICLHCNGNFKRRKNRNKYFWICSRRENGYTNCKRVQIEEQFLIDAINKRYEIRLGKTLTDEEMEEKVEYIQVEDKMLFKIKLIDFEDEIEYTEKHIYF